MDIFNEIHIQDCPYCGGAGLLDDGSGWCWTVTCMDCGSQTGEFAYENDAERIEAARKAAFCVAVVCPLMISFMTE